MKVSTKGRYALEIVTELALHSKGENLESLKNIAERRNLSEKYLERIVKSLKESGIVKSVRGAHGGYSLRNNPQNISVFDVLTAVEGKLAPVHCLTKKSDCGIDCDLCPTRNTWQRMWHIITDTVEDITIADIISRVPAE